MYFCEVCQKRNGWEKSKRRSWGACEVCGRMARCYDVAARYLTPPKKEER
jgi:hypothetical protein